MKKKWIVISLNKKHFLKVGNKIYSCQIGKGGFKNAAKKIEGDKTTPIGKWYLKTLYYRSDKVLRPRFKKKNILKLHKITKQCVWCDDITSNYYNKYIKVDDFGLLKINYENLWRDDNAYDLLIVLSHNLRPTIKNKGSAIFIHCSFLDNRKTSGCIALQKKDLMFLLKNLRHNTYIQI